MRTNPVKKFVQNFTKNNKVNVNPTFSYNLTAFSTTQF